MSNEKRRVASSRAASKRRHRALAAANLLASVVPAAIAQSSATAMRLALLAVMAVPLLQACGDDAEPSVDCVAACANRNVEDCPASTSECEQQCRDAHASPLCRPEILDVWRCQETTTSSDYVCGADGEPELADDVCSVEGEAAVDCLTDVVAPGN